LIVLGANFWKEKRQIDYLVPVITKGGFMSSERNAIKSKAKHLTKLLSEKGLELKHTQSLEVMSKVLYNKPWHSFQKEEQVNNLLLKENNVQMNKSIDLSPEYFHYLKKDAFKEKIVMGIDEKSKQLYLSDQLMNPNLLIAGSAGSGKTNSLKFTLLSHIANNSENTVYCLLDMVGGMSELSFLYNKKYSRNIKKCLDDSNFDNFDPIRNLIEYLTLELNARKKEFYKLGARDYLDYEKKNTSSLTRFVIAIENFFMIPNHNDLKLLMNQDRDGTTAKKLKDLFRIGRKYGIFFILSSQRVTSEDIPSTIKVNLSNKLLFRVNNPGEASAINFDHAQEIKNSDIGRCAYEEGFLNIPYIDDQIANKIMNDFYKPLKSKTLIDMNEYSIGSYKKDLSNKSNNDLNLKESIINYNQSNINHTIENILNFFNIQIEIQKKKSYMADFVGTKGKDRYAIKLIKNRMDGNEKLIEALQRGADSLKCNKILIIGLNYIPSNVQRKETESFIILDQDDLMQIANIIEDEEVLREEKSFKNLYLQYKIASESDIE
jgi:hypothetical protein